MANKTKQPELKRDSTSAVAHLETIGYTNEVGVELAHLQDELTALDESLRSLRDKMAEVLADVKGSEHEDIGQDWPNLSVPLARQIQERRMQVQSLLAISLDLHDRFGV